MYCLNLCVLINFDKLIFFLKQVNLNYIFLKELFYQNVELLVIFFIYSFEKEKNLFFLDLNWTM